MYCVFFNGRYFCTIDFRSLLWVLLKYNISKGNVIIQLGRPLNPKHCSDAYSFKWQECRAIVPQASIVGHIGDDIATFGSVSFSIHRPVRRPSDVLKSA